MEETKQNSETKPPMDKQIDIIKDKCKTHGLDIRDVFRTATGSVDAIYNWNRSQPTPITNFVAVQEEIEKRINQAQAESIDDATL